MSKIREELENLVGLTQNKKEDDTDYVIRLINMVATVEDKDFDKLDKETQKFADKVVQVINHNAENADDLKEIPLFPNGTKKETTNIGKEKKKVVKKKVVKKKVVKKKVVKKKVVKKKTASKKTAIEKSLGKGKIKIGNISGYRENSSASLILLLVKSDPGKTMAGYIALAKKKRIKSSNLSGRVKRVLGVCSDKRLIIKKGVGADATYSV